jgi:hypothetical protein
MFFKQLLLLCLVCLCTDRVYAAEKSSQSDTIKLTPDTCVALQQGRLCYATIRIKWQTDTAQDLCLHAGQEQLYCWQASREGQLDYEFVGQENVSLQLIGGNGVVAEAVIKVNWVQKNSKVKRHWRLF